MISISGKGLISEIISGEGLWQTLKSERTMLYHSFVRSLFHSFIKYVVSH